MIRERGIIIDLYDDEKLVAVLRRHWLAILNNILIFCALIIFFIVGISFSYDKIPKGPDNNDSSATIVLENQIQGKEQSGALKDSDSEEELPIKDLGQKALIVLGSIYILSVLGYAYIVWFDFYLDIFVITDQRILRVEQAVLFNQKVSETSFQHIQDVSSQVKGVVRTLLNVGTIFIETAGEQENFSFTYMRDPSAITATILELQKRMWDDEGPKGDLMDERRHQKIERMNGRNLNGAVAGVIPEEKPVEDLQNISRGTEEFYNPEFVPKEGRKREEISEDEILKPINRDYNDGRRITKHGVIWQSDQDITSDILDLLNNFDKEKESSIDSEW